MPKLDPPAWLFILSAEDHQSLSRRFGATGFARRVADRLTDATAHGRRPILHPPRALLEQVRGVLPAAADPALSPELAEFCAYPEFRARLLGSEVVFYWNLFSSSIPQRLASELPFFVFDPGHMAAAIPPLHRIGLRAYYGNFRALELDFEEPLTPDRLETCQRRAEEIGLRTVREHFRRSPSPAAMIAELIAGRTQT